MGAAVQHLMVSLGWWEESRANMGFGHHMANPGRVCTDRGCAGGEIEHPFPLCFPKGMCV